MMMNKKCLFLILALVAVLAVAGFAMADPVEDPVKVSMELSTNKFTEPAPVTVSITLANVGEGDLPGPITLYYPDGKKVEEFGSPTLSLGSSRNWSGTWKVTQKEMEAGRITFSCKYSIYNDAGELNNKTKYFSRKIVYSGAEPQVEVNRTITPAIAQKGQEVTVSYEITNTGTVDVTDVTIKENASISNKTETIDKLAVGQVGKQVFTVAMGTKDLTSAATVTYKAGGKTFTTKVDAATVKYGEVKLNASLVADKKGGAPGETVKLTLTLKNTGTMDFTNIQAADESLGVVFSDVSVPAGQTVILEKEIAMENTVDLLFTVTGEDASSAAVETATGRVHLIATDPTQQIMLSVRAEADRDTVHAIPGLVRFGITVHNESAVEVKNITVRAVNTALYTFDSIPAGASQSFVRDMEISMAGTFQFTATCRDQLDQTLTFTSNAIPIQYASPTPVPTAEPLVTPPAPAKVTAPPAQREPEWLSTAETVAGNAKWILAGLSGVLVILLLVGAVRRSRSRSQSKRAMDHLEGATYRDYSVAPRGGKRNEVRDGLEEKAARAEEKGRTVEQAAPEAPAAADEPMADTLKRLYTEDAAPAGEPAQEKPAEEKPAEEKPAEDAPATPDQSPAPEPEKNPSKARRRRSGKA